MIGACVYVMCEQAVSGMVAPNNYHHHLLLPVGIHASFTCVMHSYITRDSQRLMPAILSWIAIRLPTPCAVCMWHSL